MTFSHNDDYSCHGKKPHGSATSSLTQAIFLYDPVQILPYISVLLPSHSVHTPFGGMDNHLITSVSARPLTNKSDTTTGRAEGVKQHHTHHLCDLQMTSTIPWYYVINIFCGYVKACLCNSSLLENFDLKNTTTVKCIMASKVLYSQLLNKSQYESRRPEIYTVYLSEQTGR